jgi:S-adenosylmethionine:tRNA ribosyltransferase-isomerase
VRALAFDLPTRLEATEPPEQRGLARDEVRLMVARRSAQEVEHGRFRDVPELLDPGDLLVVNVSATLPAAVPATLPGGGAAELRFATAAPDLELHGSWWIVELRSEDGARPYAGARAGERVSLPAGTEVELVAPYAGGTRLWLARVHGAGSLREYLAEHGHPIRYGYVPREWPLDAYQTVFATEPGSAEMPSAGRPFSHRVVDDLARRGVRLAEVTLHTGVSSAEAGEPPPAEWYRVPAETERAVAEVRARGGRVIAVGTTVVRALESAAPPSGPLEAREGWTELVLGPGRAPRLVDGLVTGWHEPQASHLLLLEAVAGPRLVGRAYAAALRAGYRWHEFGDSCLLLPDRRPR